MRHLFLFACLVAATPLFSQYTPGSVYMDGASDLTYTNDVGSEAIGSASLSAFTQQTGVFVTDRLLVGGIFEAFANDSPDRSWTDNASLAVGAFGRYYLPLSDQKKLRAFGEVAIGSLGVGTDGFFTGGLFFLGAGLEKNLGGGTVATGSLRYVVNNDESNDMILDLRLNAILSGMDADAARPALSAKAITAESQFGELAFRRFGRDSGSGLFTSLRLNPTIGYFLTSRVHLIGDLVLSHSSVLFSDSDRSGSDFSIRSLSASLEARYYLLDQASFLPYVSAALSYTTFRSKVSFDTSSIEQDINQGIFRLGGGLLYFLTPSVALDVAAFYSGSDTEVEVDQPDFLPTASLTNNSLDLTVGVQFFLFR